MEKLFFGEIESQGRKAMAEQARLRGTKTVKDTKPEATPMKDLAQKNENQAGGSY